VAKLDAKEIETLLAAPEMGVLATVDADGRPEGSPVWFEHRNGKIYILVHNKSTKARNLTSNPNASLTVDTRVAPYRGVTLRGTAKVSGPDPALRRRLAARYLGDELGQAYIDSTVQLDGEDALVEMTITGKFSWDYSKGF
jgi:PPOX class probable F420-dependent enzyme